MKRIYVLVLLFLFTAPFVHAKEYPALFRGIRPMGMGGAFTAVANDENALFYNPAGLSGQSLSVGIFNPLIEVGEKSIELYRDIKDADMDDTEEAVDLLREYVGEHQHLRAALFPHAVWDIGGVGVGVSGIGQATLDTEVNNPVWPEVETRLILDYGALGGAGVKIPTTGLKLGASLKFLNRQSLAETYTAVDIAGEDFEDTIDDDLESGTGIGADIGLIYTLDLTAVDIAFGAVVQNIPEMKMDDAEDIKTQVNAGIAVKRNFVLNSMSATFAFDYIDIGDNLEEDSDFPKRLHLGAELNVLKWLALRAGINQGYWTAGLTLNLWVLRFDFATYGEEVGAHAGQREDRRYVGQFSIGW